MNAAAFFQPPAGWYPELSEMVRRELEGLLQSGNVKMKQDSDCLFTNIQNYLELLVWLLPKLAERLLSGPHVVAYINARIAEVEDETDFSDLDLVDILCERQLSLRQFVGLLQRLAAEINSPLGPVMTRPTTSALPPSLLDSSPMPSFSPPAHLLSPSSINDAVSSGICPNEAGEGTPGARSPPTRTSVQGALNPGPHPFLPPAETGGLPVELARRGKGRYTCPHLSQCTKGGVNADGSLVVFERNSAYKMHLQKHEKPYKCDLPGCPNRLGFAREDQLRRHQQTTRHG